jgi:ribosomal protein S18 acetylase RimI-like enzyme
MSKTFSGQKPHFLDIRVGKLKKKDAGRASVFLYDIFNKMSGVFPQYAILNFIHENREEKVLERMEKSKMVYLAAKEGDNVVGMAHGYIYGGIFYLIWIGVEERLRGSGLGTKLLKELERRIRKRCHKIHLISAVDLGVLSFYKKNGYSCEGLLRKAWWGVDYYSLGKIL